MARILLENLRLLLVTTFAVGCIGCAGIPRTEIHVTDAAGKPVEDFPLRVELGEGVTPVVDTRETVFRPVGSTEPQAGEVRTIGVVQSGSSLRQVSERVFELNTDVTGRASISYRFNEKQPSNFKMRYFGAVPLPPVNVDVIPLKPLPKGSRISLGVPNP